MHIETLANLQTEEKMNGLVTEIDSANSKIRLLEQTVSTLIAMMSQVGQPQKGRDGFPNNALVS